MSTKPKKIIMIAGPDGAGKTTFARSFLPAEAHLRRFDAGLRNFHGHYRHAVNDWVLCDNASDEPTSCDLEHVLQACG